MDMACPRIPSCCPHSYPVLTYCVQANESQPTAYDSPMSSKYLERIGHIEKLLLLENLVIDVDALRAACVYGIPDHLRPLCWRLFLNCLPKSRQRWAEVLQRQREHYEQLLENMIAGSEDGNGQPAKRPQSSPTHSARGEDHPLAAVGDPLDAAAVASEESPSGRMHSSDWARFFRDNATLSQIDKDVRRLRPEIDFFQRANPHSKRKAALREHLTQRLHSDALATLQMSGVHEARLGSQSFIGADATPGVDTGGQGTAAEEKHWEVVERMLFIFSRLNPGIGYIQGMNELLGPIYYVLATDTDREWAEWAEPDTFYCFQNLMSEVRDNFISTMDNSHCGIEATLARFHQLLHSADPPLYDHLVSRLGVKPQYYSFRWISLLLSQEFSLPDLIALWDLLFSFFSTADSQLMLSVCQHLCLSMVLAVREELLQGDFSACVRLLQNYPNDRVGVDRLISMTLELRGSSAPAGQERRATGNQQPPAANNDAAVANASAAATASGLVKEKFRDSLRIKSRLATLINTTRERVMPNAVAHRKTDSTSDSQSG